MKKATLLLLVLFSIFMIMVGCDGKQPSLGSFDKVYVMADSLQWIELEDDVRAILGKELFTPHPEEEFDIAYRQPKEINQMRRLPLILFVTTLDVDGSAKEIIDQMLPAGSQARDLVEKGERYFFSLPDAWAQDQLLAVAVAKDLPTLQQSLAEHPEILYDNISDYINKHVEQSLYVHFEIEKFPKQFMDKHGWSIRVPHDYFCPVDSAEIRFTWIRRLNPQRWVSIYYEPVEDPSMLTKEWMLQKRAELADVWFDGDFVYEDSLVKVQERVVNFNDRYAIQLDGVWQNDKHIIGGPFRAFGFYEESDGRLYLIDCGVLAPGERKQPFLRQVEAIARTFKTKNEL